MSVLATDKKLISFGTDYSAGSGISIIDHTISIVPSAVGKTYSAGPNIEIYDVSGQPTISSKDWSSDIANASANAYTQSTSYFNEWINGQYTGDITNITNNITALSGDLSGYYKKTETSSKEQINDALQYVSANAGKVYEGISPIVVNNDSNKISADTWTLSAGNGVSFTDDSANKVTRIDVTAQVGDEGVNSFVHNNSATILDVNSSYQANSGNFLTAIPSDVATTGDVANLEQTISENYYSKSNPSSFATESWVNGQGFLTAHQDISNKLDSSAFSSVSGDFLTTSFSIPESAVWNETSNVVQTNSAQWGQGGGGSVSSKYGTISVDGSNIEATNKAIEYNSNRFTSAFGGRSISNGSPVVFTWDNYSQETSIIVEALNMSPEDATLTYSSNTNVTGEVTTASYNSISFSVQIPNATAIQFTTDKSYDLNRVDVTAPSSFKVSELAWKSDIPTYTYNNDHKVSAINGSALVGNEDYLVEQGFVQNLTSPKGTVSVLNNNKIEGTNSAIASDIIEGFVSSYNGMSVYPGNSATLTWDRYVPNTMLFVSGAEYQEHTLTYSANTDVTGVITTTTAGQISVELPTDSTSIVIGNEDWGNTTYNFTVSADNYYEIGELAWASAIPTYEYDTSNKISAINGSAIAGGTVATSAGIVGDGSTQNPLRADETVLYSGAYDSTITSCQLSEPITNFQYIKVDWKRGSDAQTTLETSIYPSVTKQFNHIGKQNQSNNYYYEYHAFWDVSNSTAVNHSRTFLINYPKAGGNITTYQNDYNEVIPIKIVGINRIANN